MNERYPFNIGQIKPNGGAIEFISCLFLQYWPNQTKWGRYSVHFLFVPNRNIDGGWGGVFARAVNT